MTRVSIQVPSAAFIVGETQFQNLNQGYETKLRSECYIIDGTGRMRTRGFYGNTGVPFDAGPGLTVQSKITYDLGEIMDANGKIDAPLTKAITTNAKLVCIGDFQGIFNLDPFPIVEATR